MDPLKFPEQTNLLAAAQPQYRVLPIAVTENENPVVVELLKYDFGQVVKMTCKYQFSDLEIEQIIKTRSMFISQFGDCFHPIYPQTDNPFLVLPVGYKINSDGSYKLVLPKTTADGSEIELNMVPLEKVIDEIIKYFPDVEPQKIHFRLLPSLGVDADGIIKMI